MFKRAFSSTIASRGLFKDYIAKLTPNVKEITLEGLKQKIAADPIHGPPKTFHLLDVRETYEWNEDHIPFATYTGRGNLERDIQQIVPDVHDEIVLYCAGGFRSIIAADTLTKMGYKNVSSLKGGIGGWKNDGNYIVTNQVVYSERLEYGKPE
ncbi:hypothetical protein HDV01_001363 [Terramyces sp. JEL0728]|nr:hypothetical protein HDV01_001363 [Terramyces sp. JEL0728]